MRCITLLLSVVAAGVQAYFERLAGESKLDILLYNIPAFATPIAVETVVSLATDQDRIIGIKDSSGSLPNMMRMVAAIRPKRPDFIFFTGWDGLLAAMLSHGADGGMVATAGVVPEVAAKIYKLASGGNIAGAIRLQCELLPLFDKMLSIEEFPEGFRIGANIRGWQLGRVQTPLSDHQLRSNEAAREVISKQINDLIAAL